MNNTLKTLVAVALFGSLVGGAQAVDITAAGAILDADNLTTTAASATVDDASANLFESVNVSSGVNVGGITAGGVFGGAVTDTTNAELNVGTAETFVQSVTATGAASTQSQSQSVVVASGASTGVTATAAAVGLQATTNENRGAVSATAGISTITFTGTALDAVTYSTSATGTSATQVITPIVPE